MSFCGTRTIGVSSGLIKMGSEIDFWQNPLVVTLTTIGPLPNAAPAMRVFGSVVPVLLSGPLGLLMIGTCAPSTTLRKQKVDQGASTLCA